MKNCRFLLLWCIILLHTACANNSTSHVALHHGIYLNRNLDYLEISRDSLKLADAFSLAPCISTYKFSVDTLRLALDSPFIFPSYLQQNCISKLSLQGMKNSIWLQYLTHANCSFCFLNPNEQFFREQNFFKAYPWDSIYISRTYIRGNIDIRQYEIKIIASGLVLMQIPGSNSKTIGSLDDNSGLKKEFDYIYGDQFKLWNEGETSQGGELEIIIYRKGKFEKFRGSIIPFYYQRLRQFLRDFEQNIMLEYE